MGNQRTIDWAIHPVFGSQPSKIVHSVEEMDDDLERMDMPPTPMALPDDKHPAAKPKPKPAPAGPPKTKVINDRQGSTITVNPRDAKVDVLAHQQMEQMVIDAANNASTTAIANATIFAQQIASACTVFRDNYAKPKLDDLKGEITAGDLLAPLVGIVTGEIGAAFAEAVVDKVGQFMVKKIAELAKTKMTDQAKKVGDSSKDLEAAVNALVAGATDTGTATLGLVNKSIVPRCDGIVRMVNSGKTLSPADTAFVTPFIRQEKGKLSAIIEQRFGLPTFATAKKTQVRIYQGLVEAFEEKLIIAKTPSEDKFAWVTTGVPMHVHRRAQATAKQAAKTREHEIDQKEKQLSGQ